MGRDFKFEKRTNDHFEGNAEKGILYLEGRRLDIPMGRQTYKAFKVKLIPLVTNDKKTKNVIKFNQDFLFKHILNYIILY
jgi:hypothetical protein